MIRWFIVLLACLLLVTPALAQQSVPQRTLTMQARLEALGGYPCPESIFTCVTIFVPLDHFSTTDHREIEVTFGVLPATGESKGLFVTATGGPGTSGLAYADSYVGAMDERLQEQFDIVFFDQRGGFMSGNLQCPEALDAYYSEDFDALTPEGEAQIRHDSRVFARECAAELGRNRNRLPFFGTLQAVEDLEVFRQQVGDPQMWLYGESYGTEYAQLYAAAHGDHLGGLFLDGPVDLTLTGLEYYAEQTQAFSDVLTRTLDNCTANPACAADVAGGDLRAFYDQLYAQLSEDDVMVDFPLLSGESDERYLSRVDLDNLAGSIVYSYSARMMFQRVLAAASQGDYLPLLRFVYADSQIDPQTENTLTSGEGDNSSSDALFYAVECADYSYGDGTPREMADAYLQAGDVIDESIPYLSETFYADLPCAYWNGKPPAERPAPLVAEGIPTFVLASDADPATPYPNALRIFSRLADGYLITQPGGPHVIYGRGKACPDDVVNAFLLDDIKPDSREMKCDGTLTPEYVANLSVGAEAFSTPLAMMDAWLNDLWYTPEYWYWDLTTPTDVACAYGGVMTLEPDSESDSDSHFIFDSCQTVRGVAMTVDGWYSPAFGYLFDVTLSGDVTGTLHYERDADGVTVLRGDYNGATVDLSGTALAL